MKRLLITLAAVASALSAPAFAATNVGVSVNIGQPGFYGRLDIGGFPAPMLLYPEPLIIQPVPYDRPPIYLRVPPGRAKQWGRYCGRYHACDERVYFVQDNWYRHEYAPRYRQEHYGRHDYDHGYRNNYHRDDRGDGDHGNGNGNGHGHGHGNGHGNGHGH